MAEMAEKLKSATARCRLLEKEDQAKQTDLEKVLQAAKETRSGIRAAREELRQAGDIAAGKPFMLQRKFGDPQYAPLDRLWSSEMHIWTWRRALPMRPNTSKVKQIMGWTSCSSRNSMFQIVRFL